MGHQGPLITGLGVRACTGPGADAFWAGLQAASSAPSPAPDDVGGLDLPPIYRVPDGALDAHDGTSRVSSLALAAMHEAIADAGLEHGAAAPWHVVVGTGMGDAATQERIDAARTGDWSPSFDVAATLADRLGATGGATSTSNACAASGYAVALAADLSRSGEAEVVVAGGAEAYSRVALASAARLKAVDPVRCRPFDRHRRGTMIGEGAAMLVLESADHARRRGARRAYAEVAGTGWSCDAHHPTAPDPSGEQMVRAIREALARADVDMGDVSFVVPHGTGTQLNDRVEAAALRQALGAHDPPLYSLKALVGHTGGAAGALAVAAGVLILRHGSLPPNVALDEQDPDCPLRLPQDGPVALDGDAGIVNASAFGGNNVSLVLRAAG
jgi:3-oxoacyl-[acyl-carrier-protein] synthase II